MAGAAMVVGHALVYRPFWDGSVEACEGGLL